MLSSFNSIIDLLFKISVAIYANLDSDRILIVVFVARMPTLFVVVKRLYNLFVVYLIVPRSLSAVSTCLYSCVCVSISALTCVCRFVYDDVALRILVAVSYARGYRWADEMLSYFIAHYLSPSLRLFSAFSSRILAVPACASGVTSLFFQVAQSVAITVNVVDKNASISADVNGTGEMPKATKN